MLALLLLLIQPVYGVEVSELSLSYDRYLYARMAEIPQYVPTEEIGINLDMNLWGPLYWRNRVHGVSTDAQFRLVGWQFSLELHGDKVWDKLKWIDVLYRHHSQHVLDGVHPDMKFPVEDAIEAKMYILGGPKSP